MKIVFWGTPDFAIPSLEKLIQSRHTIEAVVTVPDKPQGRGLKLVPSAVKQFALDHNIPVLQPDTLRNENFIKELRSIEADIFIIIAFKILPEEIFAIPRLGSYNLHASLLPKYRGAAPIQWALINGESETGVTTFKLAAKVDTGNIALMKKIPILPEDDFGSLHDKLSLLGAEVVIETLDRIESPDFQLMPQDNSLATPAPKITKEICEINWNKSADEINNLIRGLSPFPGAWFQINGIIHKVFCAQVIRGSALQPAEVNQTKSEIMISCGKDQLQILELQREGRKRMTADEFLRGYRL